MKKNVSLFKYFEIIIKVNHKCSDNGGNMLFSNHSEGLFLQ